MNIEIFRQYCLAKPGATESFPFDAQTLVFKVGGKMFALIGLDDPDQVNLKCDPEKAQELREQWDEIQPGYHMNKKHWNTVHFSARLSDKFVLDMVDHSFELVFNSLSKSVRATILAS